MIPSPHPRGQSLPEFVLIAPFLFLFLFCVLQLAYTAYVSLAVQRAALAVARRAASGDQENSTAFKTQLALSLLPISALNRKTILTLLESKITLTSSLDKKSITALVHYPMPLWVPGVGTIFGETLIASSDYDESPEGKALKLVFSLLHRPEPDLHFTGIHFPVKWISFEETTFCESHQGPTP